MSVSVRVYMSSELERKMLKMVEELAERCVLECASKYGFDGEEACRSLGLSMLKFERKTSSKVLEKRVIAKASFPLPYNGELSESCCYALRQNNGLYTQCQGSRKNGSDFCKSCITTMLKTGSEMPEYGTIQGRKAVDIFEYVDPKGRKPIAYTKVMKKYKITEEQVMEEAGKLNIVINPMHFVAPEETKRGRPSSNKEPKEKGVKGRPKKEKKVIEVGGDDDDLFATLVANANVEEEEILPKKAEKEAEKEAKKAKLAAEKAEKEAKKAEKEAKLAAEKAEKEAKLAAEKAEKEAKLAAEKAEKEAKKAEKKAEKEAKKEQKKPAEKKTESTPKAAAEEEEEEEPERVKKIEFEGKKYLMSKKSGVIYDYDIYKK
jgi:flagellar biosynthesis GTPase FlhF